MFTVNLDETKIELYKVAIDENTFIAALSCFFRYHTDWHLNPMAQHYNKIIGLSGYKVFEDFGLIGKELNYYASFELD